MGLVDTVLFPGSIFHYTKEDNLPIVIIQHTIKTSYGKEIKEYPCLVVESDLKPKEDLINVLYYHGNGESLANVYKTAISACKDYPLRIIAPEYAGYGFRPGRQTEENSYDMVDACIRYIVKYHTFDNGCKAPLVVAGYSIGSGLACETAKRYPSCISLLVLIGGFTSIHDVGYELYGSAICLIRNRFKNLEKIKQYKGKVIFIHGKYDKTIPISHSQIMYKNCPSKEKYLIILNRTHVFFEWGYYIFKPIVHLLNNTSNPFKKVKESLENSNCRKSMK
jgi:pimeloyl-ACP methyl ester carboxylesterase